MHNTPKTQVKASADSPGAPVLKFVSSLVATILRNTWDLAYETQHLLPPAGHQKVICYLQGTFFPKLAHGWHNRSALPNSRESKQPISLTWLSSPPSISQHPRQTIPDLRLCPLSADFLSALLPSAWSPGGPARSHQHMQGLRNRKQVR